jgi:hypothetical protein
MPWLLVAVLVTVIGGSYFHQDDEDTCWNEIRDYDAFRHKLEDLTQFHAVIADRVERWMADHPDRKCLQIEDIATPRELWKHNYAGVDFVCGDRNYRDRKVILTKWKPLVEWPRL